MTIMRSDEPRKRVIFFNSINTLCDIQLCQNWKTSHISADPGRISCIRDSQTSSLFMNFRSSFSMFICCNLLSFVDGLSCLHMKDPFKWFCETFHYVLKKIANTDDGRNRFKFELPGRTQALT